ncbi:hypothetical protein ATOP_19320 [Granulimonas faecalis]|uniref:Single-stranded DNA-binding protein n=1 Tax=Granulimonas faecalis TaxID=2894155 RepID=A0AAV5B533_9ACTN|nr:single-stranded DNA-binding protein [Granulimonas faecalis]GJM56277.1 hypothetical protein ATOP_19320 [Granulimonas faecalis]
MNGINTVALSGNLTHDAELRATAGGTPVLNFSLAVSRSVQNKETGEYEDKPKYFDCVLYGGRASAIAQYMTKGTRATVQGHLDQRSWIDKDTQKTRSKVEVVVEEIDFTSSAAKRADAPVQQPQAAVTAAPVPPAVADSPFIQTQ